MLGYLPTAFAYSEPSKTKAKIGFLRKTTQENFVYSFACKESSKENP
jgi:hypothetical protein